MQRSHTKFKWRTKKYNVRGIIQTKDSLLVISGIASNDRYGFTPTHPIKLGTTDLGNSSGYPELYLNSLLGPNGEKVFYRRVKSCCPFKTVNSQEYPYQNLGVLEVYEVYYEGLQQPKKLYINIFDEGKILAPVGFLYKEI